MFGQKKRKRLPQEFCISDGELTVHVIPRMLEGYHREVEFALCFSSGLATVGQKEIVLCPAIEKGAIATDTLDEILEMYAAFLRFSREGRTVDCGETTRFGGLGPLGFSGLFYVAAQPGMGLPDDLRNYLLGVFITAKELQCAMAFGVTRAASVLGYLNQWYPVPYWTSANRDVKLFRRIKYESLLSHLPGALLLGSSVLYNGTEVILRVAKSDREPLARSLKESPPTTPFFLKLQMSQDADGCLVWLSKQEGIAAITPPGSAGSNLNGAFLALVPEQDDDTAFISEDGLVLSLSNEVAKSIRTAIYEGNDVSIGLKGEIGRFHLRFRN